LAYYSIRMSDLFSDPILLVPVIAILVIFGGGYIAAMIWSYNRDAKKQGKKSGCLPVILILLLIGGGSALWNAALLFTATIQRS
jgi:hypothetical protein